MDNLDALFEELLAFVNDEEKLAKFKERYSNLITHIHNDYESFNKYVERQEVIVNSLINTINSQGGHK